MAISGEIARSPGAKGFVAQAAIVAIASCAGCPQMVTSVAPWSTQCEIQGATSNNEAGEAWRAVASSANFASAAMVAAQPQKIATTNNVQAIDERADADERAVAERISKAGNEATPSATQSVRPASFQMAPAVTLAVASMPEGSADGDRIGDRRQRRAGDDRGHPDADHNKGDQRQQELHQRGHRDAAHAAEQRRQQQQQRRGDKRRLATDAQRPFGDHGGDRQLGDQHRKSADAATTPATAPSSRDPKRADRKSPGVAQPLRRK